MDKKRAKNSKDTSVDSNDLLEITIYQAIDNKTVVVSNKY